MGDGGNRSPLGRLRAATALAAQAPDGTGGVRDGDQAPAPELPREVANAREQRLLMAYRAIAGEAAATEIVELLEQLASSCADLRGD